MFKQENEIWKKNSHSNILDKKLVYLYILGKNLCIAKVPFMRVSFSGQKLYDPNQWTYSASTSHILFGGFRLVTSTYRIVFFHILFPSHPLHPEWAGHLDKPSQIPWPSRKLWLWDTSHGLGASLTWILLLYLFEPALAATKVCLIVLLQIIIILY